MNFIQNVLKFARSLDHTSLKHETHLSITPPGTLVQLYYSRRTVVELLHSSLLCRELLLILLCELRAASCG
ncbi:hypothetical protein L249_8335 [Ophiocordyceps polyrhachis-furcata BCC 54312]|uniref:Uncharacterized protein n=1 Tax=Ophiocordyceps polyrhachis-furcata BCC 54312 TaxID=1330021 RepID=A0A367KZB9_9HYPO|nr:hypothetical protein L249_8335 [Ophiocordyceps polyrhachis-furcata BCC 54312]